MLPFLTGLGAGLSLIVAIGAQNAFVLRQGLKREGVLPVVLVCLLSDALLILAGVAGIGALIQGARGPREGSNPPVVTLATLLSGRRRTDRGSRDRLVPRPEASRQWGAT